MAETDKQPQDSEAAERAEELKKGKAKIRTIRIWLWVTALLFAGFFFLSQCAMSKPKAKAAIVESCVQNVPFTEKWQADLKTKGLADKSDQVILDYCNCMWRGPLDKLSDKQLRSISKMSAQEQLDLFGGQEVFEQRDKQCIAGLGVK